MSVNNQNDNLKTDIKNFINLLQNNQCLDFRQRKRSNDSDRLSIIYSASQPQSSLVDKQSRHCSGPQNISFQQFEDVQNLFKQIRTHGLNNEQSKALQKIQLYILQIKKVIIINQDKLKITSEQFEEQRKTTDQILKALVKMDQTEQQMWLNYSQLNSKYQKLQKQYEQILEKNRMLETQLIQNHKDVDFMKKLVLVANENYQKMEKKCMTLERNLKIIQNFKEQRSSPDITSRSTIGYKKSVSPSTSERLNLSTHRGTQIDENYRKMVLRTLKNKPIR